MKRDYFAYLRKTAYFFGVPFLALFGWKLYRR